MIELIPVLIVDPRNQSVQRLAIENSDVFRSMHELLDLSLIDDNGRPSLEVSSLDDRLCAFLLEEQRCAVTEKFMFLIGNMLLQSFALRIFLSLWA